MTDTTGCGRLGVMLKHHSQFGGSGMTNESPLVSVIIPCFKQAHYLSEAIESALAQTHPNFEIIVVDDGSPDDPAAIVRKYPQVQLVRQVNQGVSAARNSGLYASTGEYLVFLDADDRLLPDALAIGVRMLQADAQCGFYYGHVQLIDADGALLPSPPFRPVDGAFYTSLLRRNDIWSPGQVMYRRDVVIEANGFDRNFASAADYDLNLRIARFHKVCCDSRLMFEYRLYDTSMSHNSAVMLKHTMWAYRSQWRHVKESPPYVDAYKSGRNAAQAYYGERLIDELGQQVRAQRWANVLSSTITLLRFYPKGLAERVYKKLVGRI